MPNKVLFLTINWRKENIFFTVDTARPPICFPLEWGYLSNGNYCSIVLDEYYQNHDIENTLYSISMISPNIVVISTTPSYLYWRCPPLNIEIVFEYIDRIKANNPETTIIIIGPHGTLDPEWIFYNSNSDYVFRGEPDGNLQETLEHSNFEDCKWLSSPKITKGIAPQREFDGIGTCNYSYMKSKQYQYHAWGLKSQEKIRDHIYGSSAMVELTRGCTFECPYCFRAGFRQKFRKKNIEIFEEEIVQLSMLNIGYVFFIDETFGLHWAHYEKACRILHKRGIKFGLQTRPDILDIKKIHRLKELGCIYIELGLEANEKECNEGLGKFANFEATKNNINIAKNLISMVNINIFDLTNPDYMDKAPSIVQLDNEGNSPPPLIPYPSTIMGDKVLAKYQHLFPSKSKWELAELVYLYYSCKAGTIVELVIPKDKNLSMVVGEILEYKKRIRNRTDLQQNTTRFQRLFCSI